MRNAFRVAALAYLACTSVAAIAQNQVQRVQFDLPGEDLSLALRQVAEQTGTNLVAASELLESRQVPALQGSYTADEAFAALLAGTGLQATRDGNTVIISKAKSGDATRSSPSEPGAGEGNIVVTGTRIRGAPIASPVIRLRENEIRERGQGTLAEAVRTIPQNFGGGQNPGVGNNVPASKGVNVGSATSVNLRGLGSDATLTLIDGHRISYSASRQAVDISTIPLFALDRIEVVPDGASALYGSDAVAGVVNVILKRDFEGLETGVRLGTTTDGGGFEQRYDALTGARWSSGGFVASYEFGRTTAILGKDRSYTAAGYPALTLFPFLRNHSATISGHQELASGLTVDVDGFFNDRFSKSSYALNPQGDIRQSGATFLYKERSFALAPTIRWRPGGDWNLFVTGSYARDHTRYEVKSYFAGQVFDFPGNCYCNHAVAAEAGGDGTLFRLPGGPVKIALGAGYRDNKLVRFNGPGASSNISKGQDSYYGYGEVSLPLISPDLDVRGIHRLSASAAARYERYPGIGDVLTPKIAAIYAPSADLDVKATWGKSFRAPTLYQQYQAVNLVLADPSLFGGSGYPAGATALFWEGGNPDLKPERATSLSATLDLHPRLIEGARLQLSYFRTRYRDRVVTPIPFPTRALADPTYADRAIFNPSASLLAAVVASAASFGNATSSPYDPASVAVLIDNRSVNAGFQMIHGADLLFNYDRTLGGSLGAIHASINATYLSSKQQLDALQPELPLAGILYNPPHWSGRGDLAWSRGWMTLDAGLSYLGGVIDTRTAQPVHIRGMTSVDLTGTFRSLAQHGATRGLEASLTVQNLFNVKPARVAANLPSDAPYDSTNYSPRGRFVAASLIKKW
jgi:outer membrane receptor protein involved in Fe transport